MRYLGTLLIVLGIIGLDLGTKWFAEKHYLLYSSERAISIYSSKRDLITNIGSLQSENSSWVRLSITYVRNTGAAWGFMGSLSETYRPLFFKLITIFLILLLIFVFIRSPHSTYAYLGYSWVLGGACGNLIDRYYLHYVVDWIDVEWNLFHWQYQFPIFNIADVAINIGAVFLILDSFLRKKR